MQMKILFFFGTRPEAIKLAPVIKEFKKYPKKFYIKVCVSGQHREMLDQVLELFNIKPDFDLNIMKQNQNLFDITSRTLNGMKNVLNKYRPDYLIVQGDTTATFAGALSAYYEKIKVAHVEAGLRSFNKQSPFPEEINRVLTSHLADLHFSPTQKAKENLLKEGIDEKKIFVTGNTVIDALLMVVKKQENKIIQRRFQQRFIKEYGISFSNKIILVTGHRRESFGEPFKNICIALKKIAQNNKDIDIIYPVHLNPHVRKYVFKILKNIPNIYLIEPLDYASLIWLMGKSYLILTDSGGIQEEAPSLGKPVLVMREVTERTESLEAGSSRLVGTNMNKIIHETQKLLNDRIAYIKMSKIRNPYGNGNASKRIVNIFNKM